MVLNNSDSLKAATLSGQEVNTEVSTLSVSKLFDTVMRKIFLGFFFLI